LDYPAFGLYKISVHFEAVVHESTILFFHSPAYITHPGAILSHDFWAISDSPSPSDIPFEYHTPYNIGNNNIVLRPIRSFLEG